MKFLEMFNAVLGEFAAVYIFFTGFYFTVKSRFMPFVKFRQMLKITVGGVLPSKEKKLKGSVSPDIKLQDNKISDIKIPGIKIPGITSFQAFATSLAGTIGVGNITGVTIAILAGGPGAVFWMWVSALFCMIIKYIEIYLSLSNRNENEVYYVAGPMNYIKKGTKSEFLASGFACLGILSSFFMGNMAQSNAIVTSFNSVWDLDTRLLGLIIAVLIYFFVSGGITRIARLLERFIPFIGISYIIGGIIIILVYKNELPSAFSLIFKCAFTPAAAAGGFLGAGVIQAFRSGVSNGLFSNEAGLGSGGLAHGSCVEKTPEDQSYWGIFEVFADTILISGISALAILSSGVWTKSGGVTEAFHGVFGSIGDIFSILSLALFAIASMLSWSFYGESCLVYLFGKKFIYIYRILFVIMSFIGAVLLPERVWMFSEAINSIMLFFNLTGLIACRNLIKFPASNRINKA